MRQKPETLKKILEELKDQCNSVSELVELYNNGSKEDQEKVIADLSVGVSILKTRSELIDGYLEEELGS